MKFKIGDIVILTEEAKLYQYLKFVGREDFYKISSIKTDVDEYCIVVNLNNDSTYYMYGDYLKLVDELLLSLI